MEKLKLPDTVREQIDDWIYTETKGIVQSGPFKGMWLPREQAWDDGCLSPVLLGCHEQELHGVLEQEIKRLENLDNPKIINVGCAEGYYAVGLARRLPKATVWVIDTIDACLDIAREAADKNNVKLVIGDNLEHTFAEPDLIVMDCEGAEVEYLDYEKFPSLSRAVIIFELHVDPEIFVERWRTHHHITVYFEAGRNPNSFPMLQGKTSFFRWMAVCENRPVAMVWLVMIPKENKIIKSREDWVWEKNTWRP